MHLSANIFDVWVFRRRGAEAEFLLLHTSVEKATRYFNGGRFWQIPSNFVNDGESILKDGLRSVHDYVTGVEERARELCLYVAPGG